MDQPCKVANPARGQLNREINIPLSPYEPEKKVSNPSRPASACSFSILRLNLVLTHGIPPHFRTASIYLFKPTYAIGSVPR